MKNKMITAVFCILLALGTAGSLLVPDRLYSETEKRMLSRFPSLTREALVSGKFGRGMEAYLSDQFPLRNTAVTAKMLTERLFGKKESGGVYFGKDGYLIDKFTFYNGETCKENIAALKDLSDTLLEKEIDLRVMLVPTATDILVEKLPPFAPRIDQHEIVAYAEKQGLHMVDVHEALKRHTDEYIYYKTDHHYTSLGAYYCYAAWRRECGKAEVPLDAFQREVLAEDFRGTSYNKVNDPFAKKDTITAYYMSPTRRVSYNGDYYVTDSIYERKYLAGKDKYAVFFNSNQATAVASGGGEGKLLILKDSYANTFAQFVLDDYAETHLVDMRFFGESVTDYIESNGITEVLVLYNIPNFCSDNSIRQIE